MAVLYSVVVPIKDEALNISPLISEIESAMNEVGSPWELIYVNDGSQDSSAAILEELKTEKNFLRVIHFPKNYGQSSAFDAGFRAAEGKFVITLDGDGQNDPADIPRLLEQCEKYDLVCGIRVNRKDPLFKKFLGSLGNRIRSRVCGDRFTDVGCQLKVYRRSCLDQLQLFNGAHRFMPTLFLGCGWRVHEMPVNHRPRHRGNTKYNFRNRSFNTICDLFGVWWWRSRQLRYHVESER